MKKLFLIIGAPGSGKTTDAEIIAENNDNITHYSTGDMFRSEVESKSELGAVINKYITEGNLVPIDIVIDTIVTAIKKAPTQTILIDGYPRSFEQMNELDKFLKEEQEVKLVNVIEVVVSEDIARDRVLGRARGADDNNKVFDNRMKIYTTPLNQIQSFYEERELLKKIDGERSIEEIVKDMNDYIKSRI